MVPADSRRIPRVPRYSGYRYLTRMLRVRGYHPLRRGFPAASARMRARTSRSYYPRGGSSRNRPGLGSSPVARHYWGNHCCLLFLGVLRCFSSPRSPPLPLGRECRLSPAGCPIRISAGHRPFAPLRGFSQLVASFFASVSQGIHLAPFFLSS